MEGIYTNATGTIDLDNNVSKPIHINRKIKTKIKNQNQENFHSSNRSTGVQETKPGKE